MFRIQPILGRCLLLVSLVWLLAACGTNGIIFPNNPTGNPLDTIQTLEQNLNQGDAGHAVDLFSDDDVVMTVKPGAHTINYTGGYRVIGPYNIPRTYAADADKIYYRGPEEIYTYISKLVDNKFQSKGSFYKEDEEAESVIWVCQAANQQESSQIEFNASFQDGKIKTLMVTVF